MKPQHTQWFGVILILVSFVVGLILLVMSAGVLHDVAPSWASAIVLWVGLGLPETGLGVWLVQKGFRDETIGETLERFATLLEDRGEIGVEEAAAELRVASVDIAESIEILSRHDPPSALMDPSTSTIVTPRSVPFAQAVLLILRGRDQATLEMLSEATGIDSDRIIAVLEDMTMAGKFLGQIDLSRGIVYTKKRRTPVKSVSSCPSCNRELPWPLKEGMQKACPFCAAIIFREKGPELE